MVNYIKPMESMCSCGCGFDITEPTRTHFNQIRAKFGKPLVVTGPARCKSHNAKVGGAPNSRHIKGDALDISIAGMTFTDTVRLVGLAIEEGAKGIGIAKSFIHIDFRPSGSVVYWDYGS